MGVAEFIGWFAALGSGSRNAFTEEFSIIIAFVIGVMALMFYEGLKPIQGKLKRSAFLRRMDRELVVAATIPAVKDVDAVGPENIRIRAARRQRNARWKTMWRYGAKHAPPRLRAGTVLREYIYRPRSR